MKTTILFLLVINSLILLAQNKANFIDSVPKSFESNYYSESQEYNPLHVGDTWQYSTSSGYLNWEIVGDTLVDNSLYFRKKTNFSTTFERNDTLNQSSYLLDIDDLDEDGDSTEELLLDSLEVPNFTEYLSYRLISRDNIPDVPFNAYVEDSSWAIVFDDTVMTRRVQYLCCFTTQIIADKFGVVWSMTEGPAMFLTGATIDGVSYGRIVSVRDENVELPNRFLLRCNFPNPFNPITKITYEIPLKGDINLSVYNILGELIETLLDGKHLPGIFEVEFDGSKLPSGIYIYVLSTSHKIFSRKMVLIK